MVRYSRFAFDNPRGADRPPLTHPLDQFDDPRCDEPDPVSIEPRDHTLNGEQDEFPDGGPGHRPNPCGQRTERRAA